jgi:hypothetical protein
MSRPTCQLACFLTIGLAILSLNACSTKRIAMGPEVLKDLKPESQITIVHYDPEPFSIWRGERTGRGSALMLFGAIGGAIEGGMAAADAKEAGAKFISQSQLTDPITALEARFLKAWQPETGVKKLELPQLTNDDEVGVLQTKYVTGYVLDFRTLSWMILPLPRSGFSSDPMTYRAVYGARSRLVRLADKTVVWQGTCEYDKDSSLTPTLNLAQIDGIDKGIVVRRALNTLAVHCADFLWRQFFGKDAGPDLPSPSSLEQ